MNQSGRTIKNKEKVLTTLTMVIMNTAFILSTIKKAKLFTLKETEQNIKLRLGNIKMAN